MDPQYDQLLNDISVAISEIRKYNPDNLKREGRDYEFRDIYSYLHKIYETLDQVASLDDWFKLLPLQKLQRILNNLNNLKDTLDRINNFNPNQTNPQDIRNNLAQTVINIYNELYDLLINPVRAEIALRRSTQSNLAKVSKRADEQIKNIENVASEINGLLESAKRATAQTGVSVYSDIFEEQATKNRRSAIIWLIVAVLIFLVLIIYLFYITNETISIIKPTLFDKNKVLNPINTTALVLSKLFIASVGYYGLYQTFKNFNVNMHLHTLDRHRANVLKTFESFVKSSDDPTIKDTMLVKAAESIFSSGDTGSLSGRENSSKDGLEQLIQINPLDHLKYKG